jgi:hypothetical protein
VKAAPGMIANATTATLARIWHGSGTDLAREKYFARSCDVLVDRKPLRPGQLLCQQMGGAEGTRTPDPHTASSAVTRNWVLTCIYATHCMCPLCMNPSVA